MMRRCGDVDASSSGGAGGALIRACAPARSLPTATASPTPRSSGSRRGSRRRSGAKISIRSSTSKPALAQQPEQVAVAELELRRAVVLPVEPVQAALRALERLGRALEVRAENRERRVAQEDELAAGSKQARGLGDPLVRVAPDRRAVLGDDDVERRVRERDLLGVRLEERELDPGLALHLPRGLELRGGRRRRRPGALRAARATRRSTRCRSRARSRPCRRRRAARSAPTRGR